MLYHDLHILATHHETHAGGYNPDDFEDLPVSEEVHDVFRYILQYKPEVLQLETPLKPFIPDYVPAVGDIDEFIKVRHASIKPSFHNFSWTSLT